MRRRQVRHHRKGHSGPSRHVAKQPFESLNAAGRSTDPNDRKWALRMHDAAIRLNDSPTLVR
jgi:hypothetical protein